MKPVVGLTGGIACGKTTVAEMFGDLGIPVVDADELAREVVAPGTTGLARIVEVFGEEVLLADGSLDRKRMGDIVFDDEQARSTLNAILHPLIGAAGVARIAGLQDDPAPYILYEAALLVETGSFDSFAGLIVVSASPQTQKARLIERDGFSEDEADARIGAQLPLAEKVAVADYVVVNDGDLEGTRSQVLETHQQLVRRFAEGAAS